MATNKYFIGFLVLVVLTASVYILLPDNVRIDVANTKTTFKVYENNFWVLSGTEYTKIYNGTKNMLAEDRKVNYTVDLENNKSTIFRYAYFKGGIIAIDTYEFDGNTKDKEKVPMSHKIQVLNGNGKTLIYEVNDLFYSGETINNILSPQTFRKMRVEWESGNYYSQIFKYSNKNVGKLTIKYHIDLENFSKDVRLFDPDPTIMNVTLISPGNGTSTSLSSQTFSANVKMNSTLYIQNTSFYIWNETQYNMFWNTTDLSAWYQFDDNTANDYFKVNNGTNTNGAYQSAMGKIGGSAVFDGVNDYINLTRINVSTSTFSVSGWFKTSIVGYKYIFNLEIPGSNYIEVRTTSGNKIQTEVKSNNGTYAEVTSTDNYLDNNWHFFTISYNGTNLNLFVDNTQKSSSNVAFGSFNNYTGNYIGIARPTEALFNGSIDDVRIYNRSLSVTEISNLYNIEKIQYNDTITGTNQNSDFTYSVTGLKDGKKYWNVYAYDNTSKYGSWQSSNWELTENACTYTTGNWNILFSDYCNITTNTAASAGVNNITITGIGIFTTTANITGFKNVRFSGTAGQSTVRCLNAGCFK